MTTTSRDTTGVPTVTPTLTQGVVILLLTFLDTTWRAFVPTIGGTIAGIALDNATGRAPLFTTAFIIIGFALSALLITLQIRRVRKSR
jgi:hypothetical protein